MLLLASFLKLGSRITFPLWLRLLECFSPVRNNRFLKFYFKNSIFIFCFYHDLLFLFFNFYLCIDFWLYWVFVAARRLSLAVLVGAACAQASLVVCTGSRHAGFSGYSAQAQQLWLASPWACRLQQLWCTGFSCSVAPGIFPGQGSNPCPPHWQVDS